MADASTAQPGMGSPWSHPPRRPARHDPGRTALASAVAVLTTLIGILFLAWLVLFITKGRFLKATFERIASSKSGRKVTVSGDFNLYLDPFAIKFLAEGLTISNPSWASKPNLFESSRIDTRIDTFSFLFGNQSRINWLGLVNGAADLEWDAKHKRNTWTFAGPSANFQIPLIQRAAIDGTTLRYRDPAMQVMADITFHAVNAQNNKVENAIRFDGKGSARGYPFTLTGAQSSPNQLIAGGENRFELHADAVKSHLDVSGTLPGATVIEGADLAVALRGENLRNIFDVAGIAVPDTRAYRLSSHLTKHGNEYRFTRLAGSYGDSDLGGSLTVVVPPATDKDARMKLTADLASKRVDLVDIGPFIGYNPNTLATKGATAAATTQAQHKGDATPRILPDAPLRIDAIKAFDANVKYRVAQVKQPFVPISNIVLGLNLDHSLLALEPLNFDMAGGHVDSTISINARAPAVVTDYDIRMTPTPLGKLFARFGVAESGTTGTIGARIKMHGTGDTVRKSLATSDGRIAIILPRGTFWTKYIQLSEFDIGTFVQRLVQNKGKSPVEVNCGLIAFTVRDGIAAADPVVIDTTKDVMTATGGFSFRDESLSLLFRSRAKTISLFSAQSPVGINGHFAAPGFQIVTPQLLARAGGAVALGVVATPLATLLAFVDPGGTKGPVCGPVLAGATAAAQHTDKGKPVKGIGTGKSGDVAQEKKPKKILGIKL